MNEMDERLKRFATALFEWRGGEVDWPEGLEYGEAVLPPDVARGMQCEELAGLSVAPEGGSLHVSLVSDFLEKAELLFGGGTLAGCFSLPDMYLKQSAMDEPVARAYQWLNAKVKVVKAVPEKVEYHFWWFMASIASEDRWEDLLEVAVNSSSGATLDIPADAVFASMEPNPSPGPFRQSYPAALHAARARTLAKAASFLARMDQRVERDLVRVKEYYRALLRETEKKLTKVKDGESGKKIEDLRQAVELERRRKTLEIETRYKMTVNLNPVVLIRVEALVLAVLCEVFRKQQRGMATIYWNPLSKALEPLACNGCGTPVFSVGFDEQIKPFCRACLK